jgi:hypothetical protein
MTCKGVWGVEIKGPYGWERVGTAFLKNGEYLAAGLNHYSIGTYQEDGDNVEISSVVTQHGQLRTIFGQKYAGDLQVKSKCKIKEDKIIGTTRPKGSKKHDLMIRLTRLRDFD